MNWKTRLILRDSTFTAIAFTVASYSYWLIAVWGIQDHFNEGPIKDYLASPYVHIELLLFGLLFGALIGVINRITDTPGLRTRPLGYLILHRTILYAGSLLLVSGLVFLVFVLFVFPTKQLVQIFSAMSYKYAFTFFFWIVLVATAVNFLLEIERIIGPGTIWRLITGRYRRPQVEERVFLFMDLKGSTTIAERLEHARYSELLQACYRDLSRVVLRHQADIYQYIGDEVVMSWPCGGKDDQKRAAIYTCFEYQAALRENARQFADRFGLIPEFRGAIDAGPVTVIEVGDVKRQIVYHGDVLNTASRLLELCKRNSNTLVVSDAVGRAVAQDENIHTRWSKEVTLRGKQETVIAHAFEDRGMPDHPGLH